MRWRWVGAGVLLLNLIVLVLFGWDSPSFVGVIILSFLALLLATVLAFPSWVTTLDQAKATPPADLVKARNDVRTALLQGFGSVLLLAGAGVAFTQLRTSQQELRTSAQGQQTERFSRAVEQLAAATPSVRLGGIFTLVQLAEQNSSQRTVVAQILGAYVQERAPRPKTPLPPTGDPTTPLTLTMPDVQACLDFLASQPSGGDLASLLLENVALRGVTFEEGTAQLEKARLRGADLTEARIVAGRLADADLTGATLSKAILLKTDLRGARLAGARLADAKLRDARLDDADLAGANLHGADMDRASLRNAVLAGADLSSAYLGGDLAGADLRHANLRAADLQKAGNLLQADLTGATCDGSTRLPATVRCQGDLVFLVS